MGRKQHLELTRDIDPTIFEISKLKKTDDTNTDGNHPANDKTENKEVAIKPDEKTKIITTKSNKKEKENEDKEKKKKEIDEKIGEEECESKKGVDKLNKEQAKSIK